jgi:hypothetical protein
MEETISLNSSCLKATSHINNTNTSDKVNTIISTLEDIVSTFKAQGCPEGKELLREILLRNHLLGGSSVLKSRLNVDAMEYNVGIRK